MKHINGLSPAEFHGMNEKTKLIARIDAIRYQISDGESGYSLSRG
jgi:hypothetical protein